MPEDSRLSTEDSPQRRLRGVRRPNPVAPAAALAVALCLLGACSGKTALSVPSYALHGLVTAPDCGKFGLYDLINAPVRVRDPSGKVIGTATTATQPSPFCHVPFTVQGLPPATTYRIDVGFDGGPTYTFWQLASKGWRVSFTVGGE